MSRDEGLERACLHAYDALAEEWASAAGVFDTMWNLGGRWDIYAVEDSMEELYHRGLLERSSERVDPGDLQNLVLYRRRNP